MHWKWYQRELMMQWKNVTYVATAKQVPDKIFPKIKGNRRPILSTKRIQKNWAMRALTELMELIKREVLVENPTEAYTVLRGG